MPWRSQKARFSAHRGIGDQGSDESISDNGKKFRSTKIELISESRVKNYGCSFYVLNAGLKDRTRNGRDACTAIFILYTPAPDHPTHKGDGSQAL